MQQETAQAQSTTNDIDSQKKLMAQMLAPVQDDISSLKNQILNFLPLESNSAKEVCQHTLNNSGKMIRPALYYLACRMVSYRGEHLHQIAAVSEYVHTASLLHDDVIDDSEMRRNKKTARSIWGDETAVLVGDLIYSRASELMAKTGHMDLVKTFAKAIRLMSEGELLQLENVFSFDIKEETYLRILHCKTGVLIGAACRAAAVLANLVEKERDALEKFGQLVGMSFQIIDDALDYLTDGSLLGKPSCSDLLEGKVTMPVILLKEKASNEELKLLSGIINKDKITPSEVTVVSELIKKYQTAATSIEKAREYTEEALSLLKNNFADTEHRTHLENLTKTLLLRFY